jgi:hypothetical protein
MASMIILACIIYGCDLWMAVLGYTCNPIREVEKDYRFQRGGFAIIVAKHSVSTKEIISQQSSKLHKWLEAMQSMPSKCIFIGNEMFTTM